MIPLNPRLFGAARAATDERTIAARLLWLARAYGRRPFGALAAPTAFGDGMFGDEKDQLDLVDMFMEPTNE